MAYIEMSSNLKFLIIDNVQNTSIQMKQDLVKVGYRNSVAVDDEVRALDLLRKEPFDFVFCRQNMPNMTGTEILEELKNDYNVPRRPFITYMEKTDKDDVMLAKEMGADNLIIMPYNIKDLAERITSTWAKFVDQNNPELLYEMGRRHFLQKQYKEAIDIFQSMIKEKLMIAQALAGLVRVELAMNLKPQALEHAKSLNNAFPKMVLSHHWLGEAYAANGNNPEAVKAFLAAIQLSPKNAMRYQKVTEILTQLQQWETIVQILKQAEERKLTYNFVEEGLARALIKLGRKEEAIEYYMTLVKRNPKVANYCNNIAVCFMGLHNYNKAMQYLNRGLEVDPKNVSILFNLALSWIEKDKKEKAIEKLKEILTIDPSFEKAKTKLTALTSGVDPKAA